MCLFALSIHEGFPLSLLSACGLILTTLAISRVPRAESSAAALFGFQDLSPSVAAYTFCGSIPGILLAFVYQWRYGLAIHFPVLGRFALVAALIGATEEVLYRGYIQGRTRSIGPVRSTAFASLAHTAYKLSLFVFSSEVTRTDLFYLGICTFAAGLGFGAMRHHAGSILPPIACHVSFDLIVYGGASHAPLWVWR